MDLKEKAAIITGASSGIGLAVAQNLNEGGGKISYYCTTSRSTRKARKGIA